MVSYAYILTDFIIIPTASCNGPPNRIKSGNDALGIFSIINPAVQIQLLIAHARQLVATL